MGEIIILFLNVLKNKFLLFTKRAASENLKQTIKKSRKIQEATNYC